MFMQNFMKKLALFGIVALSGLQTFAKEIIDPTTDIIYVREATEETSKQKEQKLAFAAIELKANDLSLARRTFIITLRDHNKIERLKKHSKFSNTPGVETYLTQRSSMHDEAYKTCYHDDSCKEAMKPSLYTSSDVRFEILALTPEGLDTLAQLENDMQACDENDDCQNKVKEKFDAWYAAAR
jgi:hypothetical protein